MKENQRVIFNPYREEERQKRSGKKKIEGARIGPP